MLGIVSKEQRFYDKAHEYHRKALSLVIDKNVKWGSHKANSLNNIGNVYRAQKRYKEAIVLFRQALEDKTMVNNRSNLYAVLLDNLAYSKSKIKDDSELPDLFYESLKIKDSLNLDLGIIYTKLHLSEYYSEKGDTVKAKKNAKEALDHSRRIKKNIEILGALSRLSIADPAKASVYRKEYIRLSDSLHLEERKIKNKFARIRYETDEMIVEKDKAVFQKWTMFWIAVSVLLSGLVFYVFRIRKTKQRELLLILSRQKADQEIYHLISDRHLKFEQGREKEKRRVARELHDGVLSRLSDIRTNLLVLENKTDLETVRHCISQVAEIQDVEKEVRDIAHGLERDSFSTKRGYQELLESVIIGMNLKIDNTIDWDIFDNRKKLGVYHVLQECLNFMDKKGTSVGIHFYKDSSFLIIEVNGIRFDTEDIEKRQALKNIGLRIKEMDADLITSAVVGKEMVIKITVPPGTNTNQNFRL
ncbi:tetratricopeptide repeat-containing sensor histidine kinase [Flavobacterium microcysteis]|uniref:Tetratricopeptide repeat protein n=1 Tax=Flavobacterium microcysteis TaxID=2596891 RepID=A0A501PXJ5_9FLAO|nr:tetratricopeptide repeat-containing sensor histidine kinase [Flavobacterium microcysteis]TPD65299.1 tetratricopeptide repeat protein [Flavobacterium microcysteis]